jgi:hypothetical protein
MIQPNDNTHDAGGFNFGQVERKFQRLWVPGFVGELADGKSIVGGIVEDISEGGFKITSIPDSFTAEKHTYSAILSGGGKHYKVLAKPCWRKQGQGKNNVEIGFKILDAPWEWVELTMAEIPEFDTDDDFGYKA